MKNTEEQESTTKELILKATLDIIKRDGFEAVTIRKIASEANVNVGLVNYHFGSKAKMMNEIIQIAVESLKESFRVFDDESIDPKQRIRHFLIQYVNAHHQYPFIARKMLTDGSIIFDSQKDFVNFVKTIGLKKMEQTLKQLTNETDREKLSIMMSHLIGAIFLPSLIEPLYEKVTGVPLPDKEIRIDLLLDHYFQN